PGLLVAPPLTTKSSVPDEPSAPASTMKITRRNSCMSISSVACAPVPYASGSTVPITARRSLSRSLLIAHVLIGPTKRAYRSMPSVRYSVSTLVVQVDERADGVGRAGPAERDRALEPRLPVQAAAEAP